MKKIFSLKKAIGRWLLAFGFFSLPLWGGLGRGLLFADEGMWMINNLSSRTDSILQSMGLELTHDQLYSETHPSLNDAIVCFGGFCSGVVVSNEGLVFTNHHCGFDAIQTHSSTRHDYLKHGFFAKNLKDELPNEGLYVAFHLRTVDVTEQILGATTDDMDESQREAVIDSVSGVISSAVLDTVLCIYGEVKPFFGGQKYYMSVYQRYDDVRLVCAPPQSLGKFGGDTDNWVWPRQTCDFSVFRIYADPNNNPAEYSKLNRPFRPKSFAHVSLQGYQPGSYCMTLGYPGSTERYLSSYGTIDGMKNSNAVRAQVRGVKQDVLTEAMKASDAIRIMYASKYAQSSNYWKYSIGQNQALENLGVVAEKQALEQRLSSLDPRLSATLDSLRVLYERNSSKSRIYSMLYESFLNGSDILQFAAVCMMRRLDDSKDNLKERIAKAYKDIDIDLDKAVFRTMTRNYCTQVAREDWPEFLLAADSIGLDLFVDRLYEKSVLTNPKTVKRLKHYEDVYNDPMFDIAMNVVVAIYKYLPEGSAISSCENKLQEAVLSQKADINDNYPDANMTLRLSFGSIKPLFSPENYFTYSHSLLAKNEGYPDNDDYELLPRVKRWLRSGDFGEQYRDKESGDLQLCFLSTNDITGGNSGSGMFDGKGRLIGLAFDGNWEAMSGDLKFDSNLQRCIGVDIRYVLSVIENYTNAKRIINELVLE